MEAPDLIARFGMTERASLAVRHANTGYFVVTPRAPYDGSLSIAAQARQLFDKLEARLTEIGSSRDRMLMVAIILADMADYDGFNAAWTEWLAGTPAPTRGCLAATLAKPGLKVEMFVICATDHPACGGHP